MFRWACGKCPPLNTVKPAAKLFEEINDVDSKSQKNVMNSLSAYYVRNPFQKN